MWLIAWTDGSHINVYAHGYVVLAYAYMHLLFNKNTLGQDF